MSIKSLTEIRDASATEYMHDVYGNDGSDLKFQYGYLDGLEIFNAGFDCRDKLDNEALKLAVEALGFYSTQWRSDIYVGPTEGLVKDFGAKARGALAEIRKLRGEL